MLPLFKEIDAGEAGTPARLEWNTVARPTRLEHHYFMTLLFSSPDSAQVAFIRSMLEAADIPCEMRNEAIAQAMVGMPFSPEIWVHDEDFDEASRLLAELRSEQ